MPFERRSRKRLLTDDSPSSYKGMSTAELDVAIKELNEKVSRLLAERRARTGGNMQSSTPQESETKSD